MVNNKTTVMEVMNTLHLIDSILKKDTDTLWLTVNRESVFQLLDEYKDYLLTREVK